MTHNQDLERLKLEYSDRDQRLKASNLYSTLNTSYLFTFQQRQRATIRFLQKQGVQSFEGKKLLEVGSGRGDVLQEWLFHRMDSSSFYGAEFLAERVADSQKRFPGINFAHSDGQALPFPSEEFDMVLQYTVFSSILDAYIKQRIACEMLRVLKPDGFILWYDFWLNPTNPQTKGIQKAEIVALFPDCDYQFSKITLAPPLARRIVPFSWTLALMLEKLGFLNTHFLAIIRKRR